MRCERKSWEKFDALLFREIAPSFVNEAYEVDYEVREESALQRAQRRGWRMIEGGKEDET